MQAGGSVRQEQEPHLGAAPPASSLQPPASSLQPPASSAGAVDGEAIKETADGGWGSDTPGKNAIPHPIPQGGGMYLFSGIDDGREWFEAGQSPLNKPAWRVAVRLRAKSRFLPLCHNVAIAYSPGQVESSTSCPGNRDPKIPNPNEGCIGVTSGPVHCARPVESAVADFPRCNPVGVDEICIAIPRVARPSQPRALRLFPVGEDQSTSRAGLFQTVGLQGAKQIRVCDPRFGVPCRTLKVCFSRRRGRSFLGPWVACFGCCGAIG